MIAEVRHEMLLSVEVSVHSVGPHRVWCFVDGGFIVASLDV